MRMTRPALAIASPWIPPAASAAGAAVAAAIRAETARLVLWVPVAFGAGIAFYFALRREPAVWLCPALAFVACLAGLALRRPARSAAAASGLCAALALAAAGAACAQIRAALVEAPVLERRWGPGEMSGRVVATEIRPEGRRIVVDRLEMRGVPRVQRPERARIRIVGDRDLPLPGERVMLRASLVPPPGPAAPGAYDFSRWAWFERIGAVGSARGPVRVMRDAGGASEWRLALNAARTRLVAWVLAVDPGPAGQVSAALLTGEMGHIGADTMAAMRDSGLAHLLSISGLHIALVAGIVFFAIRRGIALVPPLALRVPAKKIAAVGGILAITAYMLFATPGVPTQRAWLMGSVALAAVLLDRSPVSMRLVALAALAILVTTPEALLGPSFQMSFAAVVALIAAWEAIAPSLRRWREGAGLPRRLALSIAGALATTLVAGCATAPFGMFHFNRVAFYSIAANLIAVPLTSVLVMPAAVLVFLLLPFGLAAWPLAAMNLGNEAVVAIGVAVAGWPGATRPVPAMPDWGFALVVAGGLWLALLRTQIRLAGVAAIGLGLATPWLAAQPDIRIGAEARLVGVRLDDGSMAISGTGNVHMARDTWLRRAGQERAAPWPARGTAQAGLACDAETCWLERPGHLVAIVMAPRGLALACAHATLLVTKLSVWRDCPAPLRIVERTEILASGGIDIVLSPDGGVGVTRAADLRAHRPWGMRRPSAASGEDGTTDGQ
ncbi:MAG: ComEC/Rec2 family competence protein [Rhodospirillales bacterium]